MWCFQLSSERVDLLPLNWVVYIPVAGMVAFLQMEYMQAAPEM